MGFPTTPDLTRRINKEGFYGEMDAANAERAWPKFAERISQDVASVIRPGMGAVPKPVQLSGSAAGMSGARAKQLKDYSYTTTVVEWDLTIEMPRSTVEDLPEEAARIGRQHGQSASVFFDERAIAQLESTTALGYDGKALYSATHGESGTSQDNETTSAGTPTVAQIETTLEANLAALMDFKDDQGRPANEGVGRYTILVNPLQYFAYKTALDPNMSSQAIDSSGGKGTFRGMFDIVSSSYVTTKYHYIFAQNRTRKALGFYVKTDWDYNSNIGTASDAWNHGRMAIFSGYARFEFQPLDWKTTIRHIFT
jgi:hypothetical protein